MTFEIFLKNGLFLSLFLSMISFWTENTNRKTESQQVTNFAEKIFSLSFLLITTQLIYRWFISGYPPLSNLYESLLFLTWTLLTIYLYIESKTKSKLIGAILIPIALLINGFANL